MTKVILYTIIFLITSCSKRIHIQKVTSLSLTNEKDVEYLTGRIFSTPKQKKFYSAILFLYYNDSTKIYAGSDFDNNFSFYDFKPELINEKSYIYAVNKGCIPKKISFNKLKKPICITLIKDSINGISHEKYTTILSKNLPID